MTKSRHVTFRCTQEQYDEIKQLASEYDRTVSYIVQTAIDSLYERINIWKQQHDLKQPEES